MAGVQRTTEIKIQNKTFWQTVRWIRGNKLGDVSQVKFKQGTFLSEEKNILGRWREYISELLNPVRGTEGGRFKVSFEAENSPFMEEVVLAIKWLKRGKCAGVNEIRPEMLKALGKEGVQRLSRVIKEVQYLKID